jgi:hypothetical protein
MANEKQRTMPDTLFFRATPDLLARLDRFVETSEIPEMTRPRALRMLLAEALDGRKIKASPR